MISRKDRPEMGAGHVRPALRLDLDLSTPPAVCQPLPGDSLGQSASHKSKGGSGQSFIGFCCWVNKTALGDYPPLLLRPQGLTDLSTLVDGQTRPARKGGPDG